jgi:anti-sigma B factor antagonist
MAVIGQMELNADVLDGACLLVVAGDIDLSNVNVFIERLFELSVNGDQKIVLDMTDVEFIDSTVVNALFAAAPRIRAHGGDMAIVITDSAVSRILDLSGADALYRIVRTRRQALKRLGITPSQAE